MESPLAESLTVNRWKRFGKDRLYVQVSEEDKVGWWDLTTGEAHPEAPELLDVLTQTCRAWCVERGVATGVPEDLATAEVTPTHPVVLDEESPDDAPQDAAEEDGDENPADVAADPVPDTAEPARPWTDLATHAPGESARFMADTRRQAAPVRTLFARVLGVHTEERAWRIGADGEEMVAARLAKMLRKDPRWRVLHAVPVGTRGSDIDHLVIGPGGVFTVNAKHHPEAKIWVGGNTFLVNGSKQPYVRNARHEASRASTLLSEATEIPVHVHGVIVTVNAKEFTVKSQPTDVTVVPRMQVATWLLRHGDVLDASQVDAIFEVARRSTTWRP